MGQVLRITVGKDDHTFRIIRMGEEIEVEVNGYALTLVRQDRSWISREPVAPELEAVVEAIGKAIALRYRI